MKSFQNVSRPRYGAFELKAKYRRNMLMGTMLSSLLVIATTACAFLFTQSENVTVVIGREWKPDSTRAHWEPPYKIELSKPRSSGGGRPKINASGSNIVMVADDELFNDEVRVTSFSDPYFSGLSGDDTGVVPSYISDPGYGLGGGGSGDYPAPDSFVFCELMPEMIYEHQPDYPRLAQSARLEAVVWIKALIAIDGTVRDAIVFVSSGSNAGFDEAALKAAYDCKYKPGIQNGRPVPVWVSYSVEFVLEDCW